MPENVRSGLLRQIPPDRFSGCLINPTFIALNNLPTVLLGSAASFLANGRFSLAIREVGNPLSCVYLVALQMAITTIGNYRGGRTPADSSP